MTSSGALRQDARPEFEWDAARLRITAANAQGVAIWGAQSLSALRRRRFTPDEATVKALNGQLRDVRVNGLSTAWIVFSPDAEFLTCRVKRRALGDHRLRVVVEEIVEAEDHGFARAARAFEAAPAPQALVSAAGRFLLRNEADRRDFAEGESILDRYREPKEASRALRAAVEGGSFAHEAELFIGGVAEPHAISYRRMRDPQTGEAAVLSFVEEIGPPEADPAEAKKRARLAHDLRAPPNAVQGFAELLQRLEGEVTAEKRASYLDDIRTACAAMLTLVENIIADGAGPGARFDLSEIAEEVARLHTPRAAAEGRRIAVKGAETSVAVGWRRSSARRILENLIDNAIRHGGGAIDILVEVDAVTVRDEGGWKEPCDDASRIGGLGLGNCRELAEEMGAFFEIETSPDEGYLARVVFPPAD